MNMKPRADLLCVVLLLVALTVSCKRPQTIDLSQINDCQQEFDQKLISVEGYFGTNRDSGLIVCDRDTKQPFCLISFASKPDELSKTDVSIQLGKANNQMDDFPAGSMVTLNDEENRRRLSNSLRIRSDDGQIITARDRARITGVISTYNASEDKDMLGKTIKRGRSCIIHIDKIEKL
jgi:hypothetical protein